MWANTSLNRNTVNFGLNSRLVMYACVCVQNVKDSDVHKLSSQPS